MITRFESNWRRLRRAFSRSEWAVRLLRLPRHERSRSSGLLMLQIDGLSLNQFNRGMKKGKLPFLKHLVRREGYTLHSHYSGIPSNTPAVQAEIFYGVKGAVPAFCFRDSASGNVFRMYDLASAKAVGERLSAQGKGLLEGGSSYCNIFTGGAKEAHFCAENNGWKGLLHAVNPIFLPFLVLLYADIFIRTAVLMVIEFFLGLSDCVKGTINGKIFRKEFEFIFARVACCVLMRELIVAGVSIDLARGLPIIHANFIGFDDQSHRRGPSSAFAHWSLRGIDDSIRRVWNAADRSDLRDYDVWVYSDHGQEKTEAYPLKNGVTLERAVRKIFEERQWETEAVLGDRSAAGEWRSQLFDGKPLKAGLAPEQGEVLVTAMGPVGHVYLPKKLDPAEVGHFAERLVSEAKIPLVLANTLEGPQAWTEKGRFHLPEQAEDVMGHAHPFLAEAEDLAAVAKHADAGDFIVMGWADGHTPMSFPIENGAHAGIGTEETSAFALLPRDCPLDPVRKAYLRPSDIRNAVQRFFGNDLFRYYQAHRGQQAKTVSVMTYNVHGCVGMDNRLNVDRIARVIARHDPDIVCLQELDVNRARSEGVDQAEMIARKLEMQFQFAPTFRLNDEQYGNAVFSRHPMSVMKMEQLPGFKGAEKRGAVWISVDAQGMKFNLINTHLSIWPGERLLQARALAGKDWLGHPDCKGPVILCGDFNAQPRTPAYREFCQAMRDCQHSLPKHRPTRTWSGKYGISRIDHVFLSPEWEVVRVEVPRSALDRMASDHVPLIVHLKMHAPSEGQTV